MLRRIFQNYLFDKMMSIKHMVAVFKKQPQVCITADIWSANNISYMDVTCHSIDENLN